MGPLTREEVQQCANLPNHRELIESTDPRYAHNCLDTAQVAIMGEDLLTFYRDYCDRISTFHLKHTASERQPDSVRYAQDPEITADGTRWFW
ncbi:hypothetical protein [Sphingomonas sp. SAFR-052]|uniref:hypothetical protein n=1 Tax=Sphingomonas sp. SAFR-052 TaxID=3436867 RepID=UPI003F7F057B